MNKDKEETIILEISVREAKSLSYDLADLLCWWQGFKLGLKTDSGESHTFVADHGIEAARKLNEKLKDNIKNW